MVTHDLTRWTIGITIALISRTILVEANEAWYNRNFDRTETITNTPINVTISFTNLSEWVMRGFTYTEQIPSGLNVEAVEVAIRDQAITNYTFEVGQDGDVYAGHTPYRWMLDQPEESLRNQFITSKASLKINYQISSSSAGPFRLQQNCWYAYYPENTNAVFGYNHNTNLSVVYFTKENLGPMIPGKVIDNNFWFRIESPQDQPCVIEVSVDLLNWVQVLTNIIPFNYTNTDAINASCKFYRARW